MQQGRTSELIFDPPTLVAYASTFMTLSPGDLIFTGTPGGVGFGRTPPIGLSVGDELVTSIEGVGTLRNTCVAGSAPGAVSVPRTAPAVRRCDGW